MEELGVGALVAVATSGPGVRPSELGPLATELAHLGAASLLLEAAPTPYPAEPFSALGALVDAPMRLALGACCSLASGRLPSILAKHATALALLRGAPVHLVVADPAALPGRLAEACTVVRALEADGPVDFAGVHYRLAGAFNEPRPAAPFLGVGALLEGPSTAEAATLVGVADYCLLPSSLPVPAAGPEGASVLEVRRPGSRARRALVLRASGAIDALLAAVEELVERSG